VPVRRRQRRSACPIHFGLEVFGDPWTLLVLRDLLLKGRSTYSDFLHAGEGIATNVLADRLARLEQDGLVVADRGTRPDTGRDGAGGGGGGAGARGRARRYRPTAKAVDLLPVLLEIIAWSARYDPATAADPAFVERLHTDRAGLERELRDLATALPPTAPVQPSSGENR
jgi:DNA-binding HxlR family transcriptional regulator